MRLFPICVGIELSIAAFKALDRKILQEIVARKL